MNVVVCVKQIPDPAVPGALDADHTLNRDGKLILDESDSYGVEMALQLVDAAGSGEVTLVSMAPNSEGGPESRPNVDHERMLLDWLADIQSWRAMDPRCDILASVTAGVQDMTLEDSDISAALCRFLTCK